MADAPHTAKPITAPDAKLVPPTAGNSSAPVGVVQIEVGNVTEDPNGIRLGMWSAGFCDCFSSCVPNCCMVTFLPCVSLAQITSRMGIYSYTQALLFFGGLWLLSVVFQSIDLATNDSYWKSDSFTTTDRNGVVETYTFSYRFSPWSGVMSFLGLIAIICVWQLRSKVRERFQIQGSCCGDCLAACCCSCCAIAQMATHIRSYKPGSCDFGAPDTLPAYQN